MSLTHELLERYRDLRLEWRLRLDALRHGTLILLSMPELNEAHGYKLYICGDARVWVDEITGCTYSDWDVLDALVYPLEDAEPFKIEIREPEQEAVR